MGASAGHVEVVPLFLLIEKAKVIPLSLQVMGQKRLTVAKGDQIEEGEGGRGGPSPMWGLEFRNGWLKELVPELLLKGAGR